MTRAWGFLALCSAVIVGAQEGATETPIGRPAGWALQADQAERVVVDLPDQTAVLAEPRMGAELLRVLTASRMTILETRGMWGRVRLEEVEGWVRLDGEPAIDPEPIHQLRREEATGMELGRVEEMAREAFGADVRAVPFGPFALFTDIKDLQRIDYLRLVANDLPTAFGERYGVRSAGLEGALFLFARQVDFESYRDRWHESLSHRSVGYAQPGLAALRVRSSDRQETARIFLHEVGHLMQWRHISLRLPAWLEEGIAEDLAFASLNRDWEITLQEIDPRLMAENQQGALKIREALNTEPPVLPHLLEMRQADFYADQEINYALSALWVRYLLMGDLAVPFRTFLGELSAGGPYTSDALLAHLGGTWEEHEKAFRLWLERLGRRIRRF